MYTLLALLGLIAALGFVGYLLDLAIVIALIWLIIWLCQRVVDLFNQNRR